MNKPFREEITRFFLFLFLFRFQKTFKKSQNSENHLKKPRNLLHKYNTPRKNLLNNSHVL